MLFTGSWPSTVFLDHLPRQSISKLIDGFCNCPCEGGYAVVQEDEGLISVGGGVAAAAPAPVASPAAAIDEGSSLLSHDEQQEAFFADPTANGAAPGKSAYRMVLSPTLASKEQNICQICN